MQWTQARKPGQRTRVEAEKSKALTRERWDSDIREGWMWCKGQSEPCDKPVRLQVPKDFWCDVCYWTRCRDGIKLDDLSNVRHSPSGLRKEAGPAMTKNAG